MPPTKMSTCASMGKIFVAITFSRALVAPPPKFSANSLKWGCSQARNDDNKILYFKTYISCHANRLNTSCFIAFTPKTELMDHYKRLTYQWMLLLSRQWRSFCQDTMQVAVRGTQYWLLYEALNYLKYDKMSSFLKCAVQVLCQVHPNGSIYYYYYLIIIWGWGLFTSIRGLDVRTWNNLFANYFIFLWIILICFNNIREFFPQFI